ncbi:MAG TPA: hypothetical protein VG125_03595 [Pirellulales bacterium]|jgi:hypothetical protein|nr:hypothetical protein [Pirellulales bacterium]
MYVQQAHELFARRPDRSRFQVHISLDGNDAWALVATAAVSLSGQLDDCLTNDDLDAALDFFLKLFDRGEISRDDLEVEIGHVMLALADGEEELAAAASW